MDRCVAVRHALRCSPLVAALLIACATAHELVAPMRGVASESADVHVAERALARGEAASSVRVAAQRGALTVEVVRPSFCATLVSAVASRASGAIDVIASVGGNPLALCSPMQQGWVVVYEVTIPRVASGLVTVRLFELVGNLPPALRGQARVSVPD